MNVMVEIMQLRIIVITDVVYPSRPAPLKLEESLTLLSKNCVLPKIRRNDERQNDLNSLITGFAEVRKHYPLSIKNCNYCSSIFIEKLAFTYLKT